MYAFEGESQTADGMHVPGKLKLVSMNGMIVQASNFSQTRGFIWEVLLDVWWLSVNKNVCSALSGTLH